MFRFFVIGFITSLWGFYQLDTLPAWQSVLLATVMLMGFALIPNRGAWSSWARQFIIGFLFGFIWVFFVTWMTPTLSSAAYFQPIEIEGTLVDRPELTTLGQDQQNHRLKLKIQLTQWQDLASKNHQAWSFFAPTITLNWYQPTAQPKVGETWRFHVKLKPAQGSLNPGGFDYESYLYEKGIRAKGYVRSSLVPRRLESASGFNLRQALADHLSPLFANSPFQGIFQALIYGDKQAIADEDWDLLRQTGTVHLMVISGLHIGIMAAFGFGVFALFWRGAIRIFHVRWVMKTPKLVMGAMGAMIVATLYMSLAGYSIPTQRAWLMVVVVASLLMLRRQFQPWSALALAAFLILLWHPASVLSTGFWLSFVAVAIIFSVLSFSKVQRAPGWQKMLWVQLALTIGMMPILAGFYQQLALGSLLANLLAVPFVSLLGLPLLFLTVGVSFFSDTVAQWMMLVNETLWQSVWAVLHQVATHFDFWQTGQVSGGWVLGIYALILVGGFSLTRPISNGQKKGLVLLLASASVILVWSVWPVSVLKPGEVRVTVLDVGQGQAIVFETRKETVVYDTGPKWGAHFDGAKLAILPYLRSQRRQQIDLLIVSHSDQDHAGGTRSVLQDLAVKDQISGQPQRLHQEGFKGFQPCENGQAWLFSGVKFEILYPEKGVSPSTEDNDLSCVLKVSALNGTVLVSGDLSSRMEQVLIQKQRPKLNADLLIAGHHGSQTSNSSAWLEAVSPLEMVISSGFANRFGFPSDAVVQRLADQQIPWRNTACEGAIQYKIATRSNAPASQTSLHALVWLGSEKVQRAKWFYSRCDAFAETAQKRGWQP